jgi:hypothetical protein
MNFDTDSELSRFVFLRYLGATDAGEHMVAILAAGVAPEARHEGRKTRAISRVEVAERGILSCRPLGYAGAELSVPPD